MLAACKMYIAHVFQFILSEVKGPFGATVLRFWFVSHSLSEGRSSGTNWGVFLIFTVFLGRRFLFFLPAPFDSLHFLLSFEISTWRFREQKHLPARRKRVHRRLVYRALALLNWFTIILTKHGHFRQTKLLFGKCFGNNCRKQLTHLRSSLAFSTFITLLALLNNREVQSWSTNAHCQQNYSFKQESRHSRIEK